MARVDTGQRGVLERQQRALFDVIRDRARDDSVRRAEQNARNALRVRPMNLMAGERIASLVTSPNGRAVLITTTIPDTRALATRVPNYVTESGYTEDISGRTKVGDYQNGGRVAYMSLPSGTVQFLRVNDDGRTPSSVQVLGWTDDGSRALVFSTSADFKNRWIHTVTDSGTIKLVDTLRDSAWVGGPCFGCGGWYDGGKRFWFVSEADGLRASLHDGRRRQRPAAAHERKVGSQRGVALSQTERAFISRQRRVAVRAALLSHAGQRRCAREADDESRRPHGVAVARRVDARRRVLDVESSAGAVRSCRIAPAPRIGAAHDVADRRSGSLSTGSCRRS